MSADRLSCQELVELVTEYLEGKLPAVEHFRFEAHVAACPGCKAYLEQMEQTIRWTGRLSEDQVSEEAKGHLLQAFREWKQTRPQEDK